MIDGQELIEMVLKQFDFPGRKNEIIPINARRSKETFLKINLNNLKVHY